MTIKEVVKPDDEEVLAKLRVANKIITAVKKGEVLNKQKAITEQKQKDCNHRKGGYAIYDKEKGYTGEITQGTSPTDFAIIKHHFHWGDTWVRCLRCGKWWKPGDHEYEAMLMAPTHNQTSTSIQFYTDANALERVREATRGT